MPVKLMKGLLAHATAGFVVVLVTLILMAKVEGLAEDKLRTLPSVPKRHLRSTAGGVTTPIPELIEGMEQLASTASKDQVQEIVHVNPDVIESLGQKTPIASKEQVQEKALEEKTSEELQKDVKLNEKRDEHLAHSELSARKDLIMAINSEEKALTMYTNALRVFGGNEANLVKYLGRAPSSHILVDLVQRLRNYQVAKWVNDGDTVKTLFTRLGIEKIEDDELPDSPEFKMWSVFIIKTGASLNDFVPLLEPLDRIPFLRSLAKMSVSNDGPEIAQFLLPLHFEEWLQEGRTPRDTFTSWKLSEADDLLEIPLGRVWVDYVYILSLNEKGIINTDRVFKLLKEVMGKEKAVRVMIKVLNKGHILRHVDYTHMTAAKSLRLRFADYVMEHAANEYRLYFEHRKYLNL